MHLNIMDLPPGGPAVTLACAILKARADQLDRLNDDVTAELQHYASSRDSIGDLIDNLIQRLDEMDTDPDLEPYLGGGDDREVDEDFEPTLGWTARGEHGSMGCNPELGEAEPSLGWTEGEACSGIYARKVLDEDEPTLGSITSGRSVATYAVYDDRGRLTRREISGQEAWGVQPTPIALDDVEDENEHGDPLDEGELDRSDEERSLGSAEALIDQTGWARGGDDLDRELDFAESGIGDREGLDAVLDEHNDADQLRFARFDGSGRALARKLLAGATYRLDEPDTVRIIGPGLAMVVGSNAWVHP